MRTPTERFGNFFVYDTFIQHQEKIDNIPIPSFIVSFVWNIELM